jgi:two-component system sensor histidine kinase KdpD
MVRNLLAMTRIDAGALDLRRDWVDLREIVERVAGAARRRGAKQRFEVRLPEHLPMIWADAKLIEQTLGNVVANAVAHTPAETVVVIDAEAAPKSVTVRIADDGPGIAPDMLPHVFEKFVHARGETCAADGGESTGLGLAIAKGIMDAHDGTIVVHSPIAKGHGTRVELSFPLPSEAP